MGNKRNDILQGTLGLLVLKSLAVRGALHGYAITQHIQAASTDLLRVEEGSLYPALHRMAQQGWIQGKWGTTETNRQARLYTLTAAGCGSARSSASTPWPSTSARSWSPSRSTSSTSPPRWAKTCPTWAKRPSAHSRVQFRVAA